MDGNDLELEQRNTSINGIGACKVKVQDCCGVAAKVAKYGVIGGAGGIAGATTAGTITYGVEFGFAALAKTALTMLATAKVVAFTSIGGALCCIGAIGCYGCMEYQKSQVENNFDGYMKMHTK